MSSKATKKAPAKRQAKKPATLLKVSGVKKSFEDSGKIIEVLKGADFEMPVSTSMSIMGASGSGKSTFLNTLCGLETIDEGTIKWRVEKEKPLQSISDFSTSELARLRGKFFGFIFQAYHLIPELNAIENVIISAKLVGRVSAETKNRAKTLMETVGLADRLKHPVQKLSGGERQRVAIARALINDPLVILADEPTGNLDEHTANEIMELLIKVCNESRGSLLLVTHNPDFAKLTEQEVHLQDGRFI